MHISIELVPRSLQYLAEEQRLIDDHFPSVTAINIPDLKRFELRSWDGCSAVGPAYHTIPHIRARDFSRLNPNPILDVADNLESQTILVVGGDVFNASAEPHHNSLSLLKLLSEKRPNLTLYAAIDPYRQSFVEEIEYAKAKIQAGAVGFFTQPFFDLRLMEIYADLLPNSEIFWGVTPVLTDNSYRYWVKKNRAIFPSDFDGTLDWNRRFAQQVLDFATIRDHHVYFMPIRADLVSYLKGIL